VLLRKPPAAECCEVAKPVITCSDPQFNTALLTAGDELKYGTLARSDTEFIQCTYG